MKLVLNGQEAYRNGLYKSSRGMVEDVSLLTCLPVEHIYQAMIATSDHHITLLSKCYLLWEAHRGAFDYKMM